MAMADYLHCAMCGCKAIYDVGLNYESAVYNGRLHDIAALCTECAETHSIQLVAEPSVRLSEYIDDLVKYPPKELEG